MLPVRKPYKTSSSGRKSLQDASDDEDSLGGSEDGDEDSDGEEQEEEPASAEDEDEDDDQLEAFKAKLNGVEAGTNGLRYVISNDRYNSNVYIHESTASFGLHAF